MKRIEKNRKNICLVCWHHNVDGMKLLTQVALIVTS